MDMLRLAHRSQQQTTEKQKTWVECYYNKVYGILFGISWLLEVNSDKVANRKMQSAEEVL